MKRFLRPVTFLLILSIFVFTGQGCFGGGQQVQQERVTLTYWRVFDEDDAFDQIIQAYQARHPNVRINYRRLRAEEYEDELFRALAEGRGPDIFTVHNTKIREFQELMLPMPGSVSVTRQEQRGTLRRETVTVAVENPTMSVRELRQRYVDQVPRDVLLPFRATQNAQPVDRIYGLPLSMDTLALYYNRDLFNAAGIANPPVTWSQADFHDKVTRLTTYNDEGEVEQSAVAMGTSENVDRSPDIISLLMMQVGTQMTDERGRIAFHTVPPGLDVEIPPALNALQFYTDFADPTKEVYTWNPSFPNSFEAFANGETAMFIGYSYHAPLLRTAAPRLNFSVTQIPQISQTETQRVDFANYWIEGVYSGTEFPDWAWDFLLFAGQDDQVQTYLNAAGRPPAHRNLLASQQEDEILSPFAAQSLTARSWYQGGNMEAAEEALRDLIDEMLTEPEEPGAVLNRAARRVEQTYR